MTASQAAPLVLGLAGAAFTIALTALCLGPRLLSTMRELSGAPHRAQWWTRLCCAALVIGSLVAALLGYWACGTFDTVAHDTTSPWTVVDMLRWTLAALQLSLVAIAGVVLTSMAARPGGGRPGGPN
ncbi:MAG TPA: hypothetical protein VFN74_07290 [Chloroflexota bacterium]|nr:hypothetical protein [Chloroflexota bacterium]